MKYYELKRWDKANHWNWILTFNKMDWAYVQWIDDTIIIPASSFDWYVILDNDRILDTISSNMIVWLRLHFCTITQEIVNTVNKNGFAELKDDRQQDLFDND